MNVHFKTIHLKHDVCLRRRLVDYLLHNKRTNGVTICTYTST